MPARRRTPQQQPDHQVAVPGSARTAVPSARAPQPIPPDEIIEVTLRLRPASAAKARTVYRRGRARPGRRPVPMSRATLGATVGASSRDARAVEAFAHAAELTVVAVDLPRRSVALRGPARAMQQAFGVMLQRVDSDAGPFRQRTGDISLPARLAAIVTGVFGLDDRPQAKPHVRRARTTATSFTPPALGKIYDFPTGTDGTGQTIGIIELGGGYTTADLATYFSTLSLAPPTVVPISVDGGANTPTGSPDGPDGEVMLDLEVAGTLAPRATLAVYFTPNTDRGFIDAVTTAVHDATHAPTVISISWGGPESSWTAQAMQALDEAMAEASALGIAVCVAAGDDGATDGVSDGALHVDFPASSPHALACGGTRLVVSGGTPTETVWNDLATNEGATGGGFSAVFPTPAWQLKAVATFKQTGRGVPDVSADADPETGYDVTVDGSAVVLGGTSAVAPLWSALIARCQQAGGKRIVGLGAQLYGNASACRDITQGNNDGYSAGPGWDPCTGLGTPIGTALLSAIWESRKAPARRSSAHRSRRR